MLDSFADQELHLPWSVLYWYTLEPLNNGHGWSQLHNLSFIVKLSSLWRLKGGKGPQSVSFIERFFYCVKCLLSEVLLYTRTDSVVLGVSKYRWSNN